jgi:alpha-methylacyl-CoA racemase
MYAAFQSGFWSNKRGTNMLDGGAHFYGVYETADGKHVSIGSIEPQFYAILLDKLGLAGEELPHQMDPRHWESLRARLEGIFRTRTRDEWCAIMEGTDICFAPVLGFDEVTAHPHMRARGTYYEQDGAWQPAPAPRFSRSAPARPSTAVENGADTDAVLAGIGLSAAEIAALRAEGVAA